MQTVSSDIIDVWDFKEIHTNNEGKTADQILEDLRRELEPTQDEKIKKLKTENTNLLYDLERTRKEADNFLNENIVLGEQVEDLKTQLAALTEQYQILRKEYDKLDTIQNMSKRDIKYKLREADKVIKTKTKVNQRLKKQVETLASKYSFIGREPIGAAVIDNLIRMKNENYSYSQIASTLGISRATISRYLNKPEVQKRLSITTAKSEWATSKKKIIVKYTDDY